MYWSIVIIFKGFDVWFYMELAHYLPRKLSEHLRERQKGVSFGSGIFEYNEKHPDEFDICGGVRMKFADAEGIVKIALEGCNNDDVLAHLEKIPNVSAKDNGFWETITYPLINGGEKFIEYIRSNRDNCMLLEAKLRDRGELPEHVYKEKVFGALYDSIFTPLFIAVMKLPKK
jgi:hypothetical protein